MGCREKGPQAELVRVVRTADGGLAAGRTLPGRGAWLHGERGDCVDQAVRRGAFGRALRGRVEADAAKALRAQLAERARIEGRGSPRED